jgi:NADH-quinone oxidoreductase subunit M
LESTVTRAPFESHLLTLTWLLPLLGAALVMLTPAKLSQWHKRLGLAVNGLNLMMVAFLAWRFIRAVPPPSMGSTQSTLLFSQKVPWFEFLGIHYFIGVDAISMFLMLMAAIIIFSGTLASWGVASRSREFFALLLVLASGVFGSFISFDLIAFFVFNELTLIPTYLLIGIFGSGRKEYAAMKLNLMLMGGSALILLGILGVYFESGIRSFDLLELSSVRFSPSFQAWAFPVLFTGFGILGNMFPFHIWSPDGHSSAPTAVSMFLAGVHMKLGSYGCLRMAMYLLPEGSRQCVPLLTITWINLFMILAVAGTLWGAVVAVRQKDLKYMNAYSSVSHCGVVFLGLAALNAVSLRGAMLQMLAHGFITATFFCLIGMIYARTHTRQIREMRGLMTAMPFLGVSLILTGFAGIGLPGLAGFVAEFNVFLGGFGADGAWVRAGTALAIFSIVLSAVYILRATNSILHGEPGSGAAPADASLIEKAALYPLLFAIIAMGLFPGWLSSLLDGALTPILNNLNR